MQATLTIRLATTADDDAIWRILEPTFRAGETYPIPRDISGPSRGLARPQYRPFKVGH